jgi:uncharacterized DUF497 family protein
VASSRFEWDRRKAELNRWRHGVCFEEAATVFRDPLAVFQPDPDHSRWEWRYLVVGMSDRQRLLVVAFAERDFRTRLISARRATRSERSCYEKEN